MRLTEFRQLIDDEFGGSRGDWIAHSHVVAKYGQTPDELIEHGIDPRAVWRELCEDFDVPEQRRLGRDDGGKK